VEQVKIKPVGNLSSFSALCYKQQLAYKTAVTTNKCTFLE